MLKKRRLEDAFDLIEIDIPKLSNGDVIYLRRSNLHDYQRELHKLGFAPKSANRILNLQYIQGEEIAVFYIWEDPS